MASLVAYGDSDSDDKGEEEENGDQPHTAQFTSDYSKQPHPSPQSPVGLQSYGLIPEDTQSDIDSDGTASLILPEQSVPEIWGPEKNVQFDSTRQCRPLLDKPVREIASLWTMKRVSGPQQPPNKPCISRNHLGVSAGKRHQPSPASVKPYIPKRQKFNTAGVGNSLNSPVDNLQSESAPRMLCEVSERVKPYLSNRACRAEVPRRLLMTLEGHNSPVNTVKWCPVPHLSHLLLSASMDKTAKVWDGAETGRCLRVYSSHSEAVRDAVWSPCGRRLLTGSFDSTAVLTDAETGQQVVKVGNQCKVMCLAIQPSDPEVFLCGGYSSEVNAWDARSGKKVMVYRAGIQQTLAILFLSGGAEFVTSSDAVSRDSAERTLMAWDYRTTARLSNQIYHERYTCPSLARHPVEEFFVAQTNGNYMAVFSSQRPYRMNKRRRYEGHKVEGYAVHCEFSQDGSILASGSSTGSAHFYDYQNTRTLHTILAHSQPCVCVAVNPVLPSTAATCSWRGEIKVWH